MDEQTVRPYAEAHAQAIAGEDTDHAVADLDEPLRAPMAPMIAQLSSVTTAAVFFPTPLRSVSVPARARSTTSSGSSAANRSAAERYAFTR